MLAMLDRVSNRAAYVVAAVGLAVSLAAAAMAPQDESIGAWVRLVIWHGMLKWACIVAVFLVGTLAVLHLVIGRERLDEWARALQFVLLPAWVVAVVIGAVSAKLVWNGWNLAERRMTMSLLYTIVAAAAIVVELVWHRRRVGTVGRIVTALAMGVGLLWIALGPAGQDIHPGSAIWSSGDVAFKAYALVMMFACLLAVFALSVPVHRWLERSGPDADDAKADTSE